MASHPGCSSRLANNRAPSVHGGECVVCDTIHTGCGAGHRLSYGRAPLLSLTAHSDAPFPSWKGGTTGLRPEHLVQMPGVQGNGSLCDSCSCIHMGGNWA